MSIEGIDVSKWQGSVNWPQIPKDGIQFCFAKATEGGLRPGTSDAEAIKSFALDPDFRSDWAGMKAAGLVRGAYHFGRPDLGNSAVSEATWFLSVVGHDFGPGDLLALDLECAGGNWNAWKNEFLAILAKYVKVPFFYSYEAYFAAHGIRFDGKSALWYARPQPSWPTTIGGWPFVAIWQKYAGKEAGIPGNVDVDYFIGTREQLIGYGKPEVPKTVSNPLPGVGSSTPVVTPPVVAPPVLIPPVIVKPKPSAPPVTAPSRPTEVIPKLSWWEAIKLFFRELFGDRG